MKRTGICMPDEIGDFTRRQFLETGMSLVAFAAANTLFPYLCPSIAQAQTTTYTVARRLVWISMGGGWDILETVDPKPSSTSGIDMAYSWAEAQTIAGSNVKIGRWLPNIASLGSDVLLLRGLTMGTTSHDAGQTYMDTGILSNNGRVNAASVPAIVASESQATIPIIQLAGGETPRTDRGLLKPVSTVRAQNLDLYRTMYPTDQEAIDRKIRLLDYLKASAARTEARVGTNDRLTTVTAAEAKIRNQIVDNVGSKLRVDAADLAPFTTAARAAGLTARNGDANAMALALKLLKSNLVTCINMGVGGFDTHSGQDRRLQPILQSFDVYLKTFVQELKNSNSLDNTLIVLYSDFGRTPKINNSAGRDHWPVGGAMMIGGGLAGGRAVGGTDDNLRSLYVDPTTGDALTAGSTQLNPTHLGGAVVDLTLGSQYLSLRPYLTSLPALTRKRT